MNTDNYSYIFNSMHYRVEPGTNKKCNMIHKTMVGSDLTDHQLRNLGHYVAHDVRKMALLTYAIM